MGMTLESLLNSKKHDELDPDNMDGEDFMKKGDPAACSIQSGSKICLAVIEVIGFRFGKEKAIKTTATMDDLEDIDKQIKIIGHVINLSMSSPKKESWDWNRHYVPLDVDSRDKKLTHRQYVLEVASVLFNPLAPSLAAKPLPGSKVDESVYPTWRIPSQQLQLVLNALWESLEPESEKILGNVTMLPSINNSATLPYCDINGHESLLVKDIPDCLLPKQKHNGKYIFPCFLCGEVTA